MTEYERGDTVRFDGGPDWKQPYEVEVVFHTGRLQLTNRFHESIGPVAPDRVSRA